MSISIGKINYFKSVMVTWSFDKVSYTNILSNSKIMNNIIVQPNLSITTLFTDKSVITIYSTNVNTYYLT